MNNELPIPYTNYLYINPVEKKQVLVSDKNQLQTYGEVLAIGQDVKNTNVGDFVAFELWDKPEFEMSDGKVCHFVKETDVVCKIPLSWVMASQI